MDTNKTGQLIAQMRKEVGMTQKQLAEKLNISDRTVSKWERGAGFPDISMLEPLADALGLNVMELLRGERMPEEERRNIDDISVREALRALSKHGKREARNIYQTIKVLLSIFLPIVLLFVFLLHPVDIEFSTENWDNINVSTRGFGSFEINDSKQLKDIGKFLNETYLCCAFWHPIDGPPGDIRAEFNISKGGPSVELCSSGVAYVRTEKGPLMALPPGNQLYDYLYELLREYAEEHSEETGGVIPEGLL